MHYRQEMSVLMGSKKSNGNAKSIPAREAGQPNIAPTIRCVIKCSAAGYILWYVLTVHRALMSNTALYIQLKVPRP